jgi:ABC-type lipoprotein release transport system permease subunit
MVLVQSARLAVAGTAIGVVLALSLGRVVKSLTYAVSISDPVILGSVVLLVLGVALLASYVPARRAAGADPMSTLRTE